MLARPGRRLRLGFHGNIGHRPAAQAFQPMAQAEFGGLGFGLQGLGLRQRPGGLVEIGPRQVAGGKTAGDVVAQAARRGYPLAGQRHLVAGALPAPPGLAQQLGEAQAQRLAAPGHRLGLGVGQSLAAAAFAG